MEFCQKCGTILLPQKKKKVIWLVCPKCGYYKHIKEPEHYKLIQLKERRNLKVPILEYEEKRKFEQPDYDIDTDEFADLYEDTY